MAKIIEFYVPTNFKKTQASQPSSQKAKLIEFRAEGQEVQVTAVWMSLPELLRPLNWAFSE